MNMVKNGFALLGLIFSLLMLWAVYLVEPVYHQFKHFDAQAVSTYRGIFDKILATGNAAEATIWKQKVKDGIAVEDVEYVMKFVANEHNIKNVGELPLYKQVESLSGKPYRYVKIFMFCNALTAAKMLEYSDAFSAYLPCRVSLVKDKQGQLWIYSLNMDLMIHGGRPLPPGLKQEALKVKEIITDIMKRGASGEF